MSKPDLILLHAPAIYDFRTRPALLGPISDVIPSTPVFEMYPMGYLTMTNYLRSHGFGVRTVNLAYRMLSDPGFDPEKLVRSLRARAFGIDLHWLVHAQGSMEVARLVKKHHPKSPIIFGGFSASYYHRELIDYPYVDFVLRGDSTEEPLRRLLEAINKDRKPENIPNLTWKDERGEVFENPLSHVPDDLDMLSYDYKGMARSVFRHFDLAGHVPFKDWLRYPITAVTLWRGCLNDCISCGGSRTGYRRVCGRKRPAFRKPEDLARDIRLISTYSKAPIFVLGDLRQGNGDYVDRFFAAMEQKAVENHVVIELFNPLTDNYIHRLSRVFPNCNLQISPESHDPEVARTFGRAIDNHGLEKALDEALSNGVKRVDIFFTVGLPKQTPHSVAETARYCGDLLKTFGRDQRVHPYIAPLALSVDPGSRAFEEPEKHGYRFFCRTLEEHREAFLQPTWKHMLNYETAWMNRDEIAQATYEAAFQLNQMRVDHKLLDARRGSEIAAQIRESVRVMRRVDELKDVGGNVEGEQMRQLMSAINDMGGSTICEKRKLEWPTRLGSIWGLLSRWLMRGKR
ncbi:MAG: TIGR04190 family B12-binding domain/radical SAM domain protein [Gemmatimonadota bacterium]|nr:MAG: TIGR04190 family B12-binding domain/radical SAM domain protein [Gemmatimonadota bacterium]